MRMDQVKQFDCAWEREGSSLIGDPQPSTAFARRRLPDPLEVPAAFQGLVRTARRARRARKMIWLLVRKLHKGHGSAVLRQRGIVAILAQISSFTQHQKQTIAGTCTYVKHSHWSRLDASPVPWCPPRTHCRIIALGG